MRIKEKLHGIKEDILNDIIPTHKWEKKFETEEDPLGYNALYNSIQKLIEHKEKASQEKMVWKKFTEILVERMHNGKIKKSEIEYYDNLYKRVCLGDPQAWEEVLSTDLDDLKIKKVKQKSIVIR